MYYLGPKMAKGNIMSTPWIWQKNLNLLESGTINFVVDYEIQPRFIKTSAYQYIRHNYPKKLLYNAGFIPWRRARSWHRSNKGRAKISKDCIHKIMLRLHRCKTIGCLIYRLYKLALFERRII